MTYTTSSLPSLAQKVFLVTGGSAGIGFGITAQLLSHNAARIYMLSAKREHADLALTELEKYGDASRVEWVKCNLEDLKDVERVSNHLKSTLGRLDALLANAGLGVGVYGETKDGIDSHFQVNLLAQILLIRTLLPTLLETAKTHGDARLVLQSSELHRLAPSSISFESLEEINQDIGPSYLYNRSKLAQILYMRALVRRLQAAGETAPLFVNATHPGAVSTDQQKQAEDAYGFLGKVGVAVSRPFMKDPIEEGCLPVLWAATSEDVKRGGV